MKFKKVTTSLALAAAFVAAVGIASLAVAGQEKSTAKTASAKADADWLKVLEPYVGGEWHCTAAWNTGEKLVAREVFTWSAGKKFVNVKTYVTGPEGEYLRYEGMYGVKDGKLTGWNFAFDGTSDTAEWVVEGRKWSTSKMSTGADGASQTLYQSIELVEADKFHWVVAMERGGKKETLIDGFWVRQVGTAASAE